MSHSVNPGGIHFFESAMKSHSTVESLDRIDTQFYRIERKLGDTLHVYLSGMYVLGLFDYYDLRKLHTNLSSVVLAGPWQNFTHDAKEQALTDRIGLFKVRGFMGSLNRRDHWN